MNLARTHNTESVGLPLLTVSVCLEPGSLEFREAVLRDKLENSPIAIAQRVEIELIKNAKRNAPWLIPLIL